MPGESNIHTPEEFQESYGDRDWRFYRGLLAACILHGEPGRILDLGAGLGLFVECCARYHVECIGIEGSEWACRKAEERCGIKMLCSNLAEKLPFPDEGFSVVVCNQVIEHVDVSTASHMLRESYRVLRPEGVVIIYSPCYYNTKERRKPTHVNLYTPTRLRKEVRDAGFDIIAEPNEYRCVLGRNWLSTRAVRLIFRMTRADFFYNSANCVARKPNAREPD